jgi:hypothetical protein
MISGAKWTSAARAWQVLGAVVQHTSDNAEEPRGGLQIRSDCVTRPHTCCTVLLSPGLCACPFVLANLYVYT